jgi:hypothetical protein
VVPEPKTGRPREEEHARKYAWVPLWGWGLIFLLPLVASEFMFYMAGRLPSMVLFPIAWIGFWIAMMSRSDWAILRNHRG